MGGRKWSGKSVNSPVFDEKKADIPPKSTVEFLEIFGSIGDATKKRLNAGDEARCTMHDDDSEEQTPPPSLQKEGQKGKQLISCRFWDIEERKCAYLHPVAVTEIETEAQTRGPLDLFCVCATLCDL
jgi:hypothetical protein